MRRWWTGRAIADASRSAKRVMIFPRASGSVDRFGAERLTDSSAVSPREKKDGRQWMTVEHEFNEHTRGVDHPPRRRAFDIFLIFLVGCCSTGTKWRSFIFSREDTTYWALEN